MNLLLLFGAFSGVFLASFWYVPATGLLSPILSSLVASVTTLLLIKLLPSSKVGGFDKKAVVVTGCDSGFGYLTAKHLDALGFTVFAGCLDKDGKGPTRLDSESSDRLHVIQLDVSKEDQIKNAVDFCSKKMDKGVVLWGLINNAGASTFGEIEWCTLDEYKRVADVNLWGVIATTKHFLPLLRKAKGRVINMASGLSRQTAPMRSVYTVTKFGIQAFSDTLRYEMYRWGVSVSIIEPGNFIVATGIFNEEIVDRTASRLWEGMGEGVRRDYGETYFKEAVNRMKGYCSTGTPDPQPVIDAYTHALTSTRPKVRYYIMDTYWHVRRMIFTHFPSEIADVLYYGISYL